MSDAPVGRPVPGWNSVPAPSPVVMVGRTVTVSPLAVGAVDSLWRAFSEDDGGMWTYLSYGPFRSRRELRELVEGWVGSRDPLFFTFDVGGQAVGWGSFLRIHPEHGTIEVGHLAFSPRLRRTTAATEAMYLMARRVFDELGYRRYEWKCDALNEPSRRAAERLGFAYEGTFRNHMVYKDRNRNTAWFAITDDDWPRVRPALETWLAPTNFTEAGHQRSRLTIPPP